MTDQQPPVDPAASPPGPAPVQDSGWVQPTAAAAAGPAWGQPAPTPAQQQPAPAQPPAGAPPPAQPPAPTGWAQPQPTPGWIQPAQQPKGPVTTLARLAGVFLLILGVFWGAVGALLIVGGTALRGVTDQFGALSTHPNEVDAAGHVVAGIVAGFGIAILVLAIVEVFGGLAVIFGKGIGRAIGIFYSLIFGAILLAGVSGAARASDVSGSDAASNGVVVLLVMFLLYLYSLVVLLARWRGSARA